MRPALSAFPFVLLSALLLWSASIGVARAQFTQPPPRTPPPSCERQKEDDDHKSDCKALMASWVQATLYCEQQPGRWMSCIAVGTSSDPEGGGVLDPATLTHYWSYVQDGRTYYLWPTHDDTIAVACGDSGRGMVSVEIYGSSASTDYVCNGDPLTPDW